MLFRSKVQFVGTDLYGSFYIDTDVEPTDVVFTYNLSGNSSIADYNLGNIDLTSDDAIKSLAQAFVMRTSDLSSNTLDIYGSEGITPTEGKIVREEELAKDVLEIITVFSARLYGSRSNKNKKLLEDVNKAVTSNVNTEE